MTARPGTPTIDVVLGALVRDDQVLLGHRRPTKRVHPGRWDLPGGVVEAGESELAALARELDEELGVRIAIASVSLLCRVTPALAGEPARLSVWLVREWRGTPANAAPDEHDDLRWFGLRAMPDLPHPGVRTLLVRATGEGRD